MKAFIQSYLTDKLIHENIYDEFKPTKNVKTFRREFPASKITTHNSIGAIHRASMVESTLAPELDHMFEEMDKFCFKGKVPLGTPQVKTLVEGDIFVIEATCHYTSKYA